MSDGRSAPRDGARTPAVPTGRRRSRRRPGPDPVPTSVAPVRRWAHGVAAAGIVAVGAAVLLAAASRQPAGQATPHDHVAGGSGIASPTLSGGVRPDRADEKADAAPVPRSVLDLAGPRTGTPDVAYHLTARAATVLTDAGRAIPALTYNGTSPGPLLRAEVGELVEVTLHNADVAGGVTIHWHGLDVPNAEDGVAGVTQDAVLPGQQHTYRFRPSQAGTFWYHSHQDAANAVARGLYGALIIDPGPAGDPAAADPTDLTLVAHTWSNPAAAASEEIAIGTSTGSTRQVVAPGAPVRLRLINTDSLPQTWIITGAPFRVAAIDGSPVNGPTDLTDTALRLAGGGRYDVTLSMPGSAVSVRVDERNRPGLVLLPSETQDPQVDPGPGETAHPGPDLPRFDPLGYGRPAPPGSTLADQHADREFEQVLQTHHGRRNGLPYVYWTINGQVYPDVPILTVRDGEVVRIRIVNRGTEVHPMHLHGHHVQVLSRNGVPATGSPWWTDTLGVEPGDDFLVAFRADNPGVWMDHCHNLSHAASGMMVHVAYDAVTSPFSDHHGNVPE